MSNSIGAALKAARERRKLTLTQVSETTRIRPQFLQALENDDLSAMTSSAQARGFLRIYASLLELELDALIPAAPSAPAPASAGAAEAPIPPSTPTPDQAGQASRPNLLTRLRHRLSGRGGGEARHEADGASAPEALGADGEPPVLGPEAKIAASGKKKVARV